MKYQDHNGADSLSKCVRCNRLSIGDGRWVSPPAAPSDLALSIARDSICAECSRQQFPQFYMWNLASRYGHSIPDWPPPTLIASLAL